MSDQKLDQDLAAAHTFATSAAREKAIAKAHADRATRTYDVGLTKATITAIASALILALVAGGFIGRATDGGSTTPTTSTVVATTTTVAPVANRPFTATSPWNTPTPLSTQWFDTPILHSPAVAGDTVRHWYVNELSMTIWRALPTDPLCTFQMPAFVDATFNRNRPASTFTFPCPANATVGTDEDHIFYVIDANNNYVEVWQAVRTGNVITAPGGGWATGNTNTGTGVGFLVSQGGNNAGVRAANFSWGAGLITGSDIAANKIDHALVVALGYGFLSNTAWRAPATAPDNGGHAGPIAMGSKLGIPANTPRPAGLSPLGNAMFDALVKYGAFVGDFAGTPYPMFYVDHGTVAEADPKVRRLFTWWDGWTADMDILSPLIRVADYQP